MNYLYQLVSKLNLLYLLVVVIITHYTNFFADETNRQSLDAIETSLFILCLDNPLPKWNDDILTLAAKQCIHGGGLDGNSANRWFDKTLQV